MLVVKLRRVSSRCGVFDPVRLWDIAGRCCVVRYVGHNYPVHCVDAWYDRKYFLASKMKLDNDSVRSEDELSGNLSSLTSCGQ